MDEAVQMRKRLEKVIADGGNVQQWFTITKREQFLNLPDVSA